MLIFFHLYITKHSFILTTDRDAKINLITWPYLWIYRKNYEPNALAYVLCISQQFIDDTGENFRPDLLISICELIFERLHLLIYQEPYILYVKRQPTPLPYICWHASFIVYLVRFRAVIVRYDHGRAIIVLLDHRRAASVLFDHGRAIIVHLDHRRTASV